MPIMISRQLCEMHKSNGLYRFCLLPKSLEYESVSGLVQAVYIAIVRKIVMAKRHERDIVEDS